MNREKNSIKMLLVVIFGVILLISGCQSKSRTGAAIGGASGAGLGAMIAGDSATGAVVGGLLGGAAGYFAGNQLTQSDQKNVYDVLEKTPIGQTETWTSDSGVTYHATPTRSWTENGMTYRRLNVRIVRADGTVDTETRTAYKSNGQWNLEPL